MSGQGRPVEAASEPPVLPPRDEIAGSFLADEGEVVSGLAGHATATADERPRIAELAGRLVRSARANRHKHGGVDAFMHEYGLTSEEGIILMCLAEALLRIPDKDTADALIAEKLGGGALGEAPGRLRQPVRQCLHLRPDAHGPPRAAGRGQGRGAGGHAEAPGCPLRRAVHPPGRCARP